MTDSYLRVKRWRALSEIKTVVNKQSLRNEIFNDCVSEVNNPSDSEPGNLETLKSDFDCGNNSDSDSNNNSDSDSNNNSDSNSNNNSDSDDNNYNSDFDSSSNSTGNNNNDNRLPDQSLKNNEEKKKALIDIFQMVSAGCNKCEDDVYKIMWKIIKKEVQLQYSGAGKLIKSLRKKSFKETETFNALERFLTAKYHASKEKPKVLTAVSTFLSGTKDRDGGRSQRNKNIQISEELNDDK
ncbi:homeobox protein 6-like isoform X2 [Microplitis mediator]|uniref:homeobox protein 6-like isoform X2 n=1 Tax=Microplitis mediator TaxID=375433 RepID=UPI00255261CC|nr:homeobox protein 6-like isoform X2 [Microplitis mediator]